MAGTQERMAIGWQGVREQTVGLVYLPEKPNKPKQPEEPDRPKKPNEPNEQEKQAQAHPE
ncbi:MAG: hypothetical protein NTZ28_01815 [Nitrospirae bacterium]|nr:hypothetical protein [Nitrospirota bacterium]